MENRGITDDILNKVGFQKDYEFVYGPLFLMICGLLNKISFSSIFIFLYEFKILNYISYLITIYLIYKLTKNKKLTITYCFNPLILLEVLVNCHNDILVLLFLLLGVFFIRESEKIKEKFLKSETEFFCGIVFLAFSASIKYITILILPFLILYKLRNKNFIEKIFIGTAYLLVFFGVFSSLYMPYFDDFWGIFSGVASQSGKLKDSIYMIIAVITKSNSKIVSLVYSTGFFVLLYIYIIRILMQLYRENDFRATMKNCYIVLFGLIFLGLTNLTSWYLIWLFLPVFWTTGKDLKNLIWISFLYEMTYTIFYIFQSDNSKYQIFILPILAVGMILRQFIINMKQSKMR